MAATTPTTPLPLTPEEQLRQKQYKQAIHYTSLGALILSPILMIIPPRTPVRTSLLCFSMGIGANQLAYEYSGQSLMQRAQNRVTSLTSTNLPERAQAAQAKLREERHAQRMAKEGVAPTLRELSLSKAGTETMEGGNGEKEKDAGVLEKIWMGGEGEDWKRKRDEKEKEALEDGRGYGGLIMDQIWEVWNWGGKKMEEVKEKDEEVLAERKKGSK